mgnify:CR=1 FL=1
MAYTTPLKLPVETFTMPRQLQTAFYGKIYVGKPDTDPTLDTNRITVYRENEYGYMIPVEQPISINAGGFPEVGGQVVKLVVIEDYSIAVLDRLDAQIFYFPRCDGPELMTRARMTAIAPQTYITASDGSLKAPGAVVRIVKSQADNQRTDVDETGFEWCGAGTCNVEAHGVTVERISTGVYVISGSAGLAKNGWQLLPPGDPAGRGDLGIVDAESDSGKIIVRLFKRSYRYIGDGEIDVVNGEAIDVPVNSWIDVRLQMTDGSSQ